MKNDDLKIGMKFKILSHDSAYRECLFITIKTFMNKYGHPVRYASINPSIDGSKIYYFINIENYSIQVIE